MSNSIPLGILHVSREDWPEWSHINGLPADRDYDSFLADFATLRDEHVRQGVKVYQIDTKPADFVAWCKSAKRNIDASARADFANARVIELIRNA